MDYDETWTLKLEKRFQREGTDDEPLYFYESKKFDPLTVLWVNKVRESMLKSNGVVHPEENVWGNFSSQMSRELTDMVLRFLNADIAVQRGELTASDEPKTEPIV
jgi:hypothetical protein